MTEFSVIPSEVEGSRYDTLEVTQRDPSTALGITCNDVSKEARTPTFSRIARSESRHILLHAICSHHQILCCTGFSQACSFCSPSSRRVFTVPSGFLVLAAISR